MLQCTTLIYVKVQRRINLIFLINSKAPSIYTCRNNIRCQFHIIKCITHPKWHFENTASCPMMLRIPPAFHIHLIKSEWNTQREQGYYFHATTHMLCWKLSLTKSLPFPSSFLKMGNEDDHCRSFPLNEYNILCKIHRRALGFIYLVCRYSVCCVELPEFWIAVLLTKLHRANF